MFFPLVLVYIFASVGYNFSDCEFTSVQGWGSGYYCAAEPSYQPPLRSRSGGR